MTAFSIVMLVGLSSPRRETCTFIIANCAVDFPWMNLSLPRTRLDNTSGLPSREIMLLKPKRCPHQMFSPQYVFEELVNREKSKKNIRNFRINRPRADTFLKDPRSGALSFPIFQVYRNAAKNHRVAALSAIGGFWHNFQTTQIINERGGVSIRFSADRRAQVSGREVRPIAPLPPMQVLSVCALRAGTAITVIHEIEPLDRGPEPGQGVNAEQQVGHKITPSGSIYNNFAALPANVHFQQSLQNMSERRLIQARLLHRRPIKTLTSRVFFVRSTKSHSVRTRSRVRHQPSVAE